MEPTQQNQSASNWRRWVKRGLILLLVFASGWWAAWTFPGLQPHAAGFNAGSSYSGDHAVENGAVSASNQPNRLRHRSEQNRFQRLLTGNRIEAVIGFLDSLPADASEMVWAEPLLQQHLLHLMQKQQWKDLDAWIEALLQMNGDNTLYQDLAVDSALVRGDRLAAITELFIAYDSALGEQRRQACRQRIDTLLLNAFQEAQSETPDTLNQNQSLMELLRFALEKQPDYPPFGLMMADALAQSGELNEALYQVQLLPYSEAHQAQVDARILQLEQAIANRDRSRSGIPLYRNADHFVVKVVFDGRVELELMIDTGASITALTPSAIARLQGGTNLIDTGQRLQVHTANGQVAASLFTIDSMQIEDQVQHDVNIIEVNLSNEEVDGLLGMNFLGRYAFSIDQNMARLYLAESRVNGR
ncbi:retropepsin-like aspartic protease family protein [Ketobacter sp.]